MDHKPLVKKKRLYPEPWTKKGRFRPNELDQKIVWRYPNLNLHMANEKMEKIACYLKIHKRSKVKFKAKFNKFKKI